MANPINPSLRLPRGLQLKILAGAAGVVLIGAVGALAVDRLTAHAETHADNRSSGVFRPTPAQWTGFAVQPLQTLSFQDEQDTDGRIATNDDHTTPVYSPFSGRVTKVFVQAGQVVPKGAPLFAIDASEYVQAQNDLGTALAAVDTARAQLNTSQANEGRLAELYKVDGASLKDLQQSQLELASAQAGLRSAESGLSAVQERLRIFGEDSSGIGALSKRAALRHIDPEAVVRAPVAGTVVQRQVEPGQFLSSESNGGSSALFTISNLSTVWLVANVREADAGLVHLGDPMDVRVIAYPGRVFHAKVTFIAPSVDPATRRVAVRAEIANPDGLLKPEMFADFAIVTGRASLSLAAPEAAVIYEGGAAHVWLARADGTLALQPVRVGRSAHGYVEMVDGLQAGDRIATSGALFIDRAARAG